MTQAGTEKGSEKSRSNFSLHWSSQSQSNHSHPLRALQLKPWLTDTGSLTAHLKQLSQQQFSVRLLRQAWARPDREECQALGLPVRQVALIREVILQGRGQPWVYARSVLPVSTLTGRLRHLRQLDNRPLGELLFKQPGIVRGDIEIARFPPDNTRIPAPWRSQQTLWGRRSTFYLQGKPLLVAEIFLDDFLNAINPR